jgi:hypothetical protein
MAILPVTLDDVEFFTTYINPARSYISSSSGVTGSLRLFSRSSKIEKDVRNIEVFGAYNEQNFKDFTDRLKSYSLPTSLDTYVTDVHNQSVSAKKQERIDIHRFTPLQAPEYLQRKLNVVNMLMPYYRGSYPTATWSYSNYHSLNFF